MSNKQKNKDQFSQLIERTAVDNKITHIEAIVDHCEDTGLEIEMVNDLINSSLRAKIEAEAKNLRYIPGKSDALPLEE